MTGLMPGGSWNLPSSIVGGSNGILALSFAVSSYRRKVRITYRQIFFEVSIVEGRVNIQYTTSMIPKLTEIATIPSTHGEYLGCTEDVSGVFIMKFERVPLHSAIIWVGAGEHVGLPDQNISL